MKLFQITVIVALFFWVFPPLSGLTITPATGAGDRRIAQKTSIQRSRLQCQSPRPIPQKDRQTMQQQGVEGQVVRLIGNQMPPATPASLPVATEVWVYKGQIAGQSPQWAITAARNHPQFVTCVQSDAGGRFFVSLSPGEYTLFARYDSYLYLNSFQANGTYATVKVTSKRTSTIQLVNKESATF